MVVEVFGVCDIFLGELWSEKKELLMILFWGIRKVLVWEVSGRRESENSDWREILRSLIG